MYSKLRLSGLKMPISRQYVIFFIWLTKISEVANSRFLGNFKILLMICQFNIGIIPSKEGCTENFTIVWGYKSHVALNHGKILCIAKFEGDFSYSNMTKVMFYLVHSWSWLQIYLIWDNHIHVVWYLLQKCFHLSIYFKNCNTVHGGLNVDLFIYKTI